jgi:hypothetical protein
MAASSSAISVEIRVDSPFTILRCGRCGTERTVVGSMADAALEVTTFADRHLDCPMPVREPFPG